MADSSPNHVIEICRHRHPAAEIIELGGAVHDGTLCIHPCVQSGSNIARQDRRSKKQSQRQKLAVAADLKGKARFGEDEVVGQKSQSRCGDGGAKPKTCGDGDNSCHKNQGQAGHREYSLDRGAQHSGDHNCNRRCTVTPQIGRQAQMGRGYPVARAVLVLCGGDCDLEINTLTQKITADVFAGQSRQPSCRTRSAQHDAAHIPAAGKFQNFLRHIMFRVQRRQFSTQPFCQPKGCGQPVFFFVRQRLGFG